MKKTKSKTRITTGVLLISFIVLLIRLILSFIQAWDHCKKNTTHFNAIQILIEKNQNHIF